MLFWQSIMKFWRAVNRLRKKRRCQTKTLFRQLILLFDISWWSVRNGQRIKRYRWRHFRRWRWIYRRANKIVSSKSLCKARRAKKGATSVRSGQERWSAIRRRVNLSRGRSVPPSGKRSQTARVRLHFLRQARGKSLIGKSPSDYEAWKPSRRAHGALRAGGDSFRFVDEDAGSSNSSSSNSSLLRKIRSPDNCDLSSREGNPKRGGKRNRARRKEEEEKGRETVPDNTTCSDTTNLLQGAFGTSCVNSEYKLVCRVALEIMSFLRKGTHTLISMLLRKYTNKNCDFYL
ncbi:hypothetical protein ALC56_12475 [Trachymyrmex septentrionalis]|uniref:Uncharacterized protein n=1 Tax=Trachymyrmex septentrionalis TaxID=34720 RepID=A0A195EZ09_9HYME|nr:hypothetical protein ALC56_12475 [Trachymyrmex septentrionalis]